MSTRLAAFLGRPFRSPTGKRVTGNSQHPPDTATLLHDLLDERAAATPDRAAVRLRGLVWTFGQLRERSIAYAQGMAREGIGRGDRVMILAPHSAETVAALFAVSRLGAIHVTLSDRIPSARLAQITADCTPRLVITRSEPRAGDVAGVATLTFDDLPREPAGPVPKCPAISVDPVGLIYTSGSTALPKGVVSSHRQVLFAARAIQARLRYRPDDVVFCCLPLSFDYGLYQVHLSLLAGCCLALADESEAGAALVTTLNRHRATVFPLVAPMAAVLALLVTRSGRPPTDLRMLTSSGAQLDDALAEQLRSLVPGLAVVTMFGLTECKRVTIAAPDETRRRPGTCGRALPDTEIFVVDNDGNRLPPGEVGELVVRGPHVMGGYWRAPELTATKFRRDAYGEPTLYTGDQCRIDSDGHLYFVGRKDDIYKQNGFRVSAVELESAALNVSGVRLAAVFPPTADRGAVLVISGDLAPHAVLNRLAEYVEVFKMPSECYVLDQLPIGPNGKIDKRRVLAALPSAPRGQATS